ncbi:hypothetical protein QTQ03_16520 [Micromonospora sp. WMMA1363]|uniref:hypothetical protein n=1 Tax=Micromonospora sp. WMMA1363 TaxID=3053985 RepID=UPI00259CAEE4|nr:hypothetical protein [Micromonospora sp. WMMA1363]MDM4721123.1 hypothetical protein [Micromonospora sp. WMMA1363]
MSFDVTVLEAARAVEERVLNGLMLERHGRVEDPHYAAATEARRLIAAEHARRHPLTTGGQR